MSNNDVVYYNITLGNNDPDSAGILDYSNLPANVDAYNNQPILENPNDYYASIIRFTIPALNVPLLTFLVQSNQPDIDLGVYSFTIIKDFSNNLPTGQASYSATSNPVFVRFQPTVSVKPTQLPKSPVGNSQEVSPYYLVYDYTTFIAMWNVALATAHTALGYTTEPPPFFKYEPTTQLITLYCPVIYQTDNCAIGIDNQLIPYTLGLAKINYNANGANLANGLDNVIIPNYDVLNKNNISTGSPSVLTYYANEYQYNSYGYWNFLKSMLITTNMNVASEAVYNFNNARTITNNSSGSKNNSQNVNFVNILEDFIPDLAIPNGAGVSNAIFTYFAQSLYRIFTFNQKTPLYKVNLAISIVDVYGNIYPLTIPKGQLANFKIMFIRKEIYASMNKNLN